jgi:predicted peptidase
MRFILLLALIFSTSIQHTPAQNFLTPDYALADLVDKTVQYGGYKFTYKVVYPDKYDSTKRYPVFLGLSGGLAFGDVVDFCYFTTFRSRHIRRQYITILPVSPERRTMKSYSREEMSSFLDAIIQAEKTTNKEWIVAGTSYGGDAAFLYAQLRPALFSGIINFTGNFEADTVPPEWKNYNIILAYGDKIDQDKKDDMYRTRKKLEGKIKNLDVIVMEGQNHILNPLYDLNIIYSKYFSGSN